MSEDRDNPFFGEQVAVGWGKAGMLLQFQNVNAVQPGKRDVVMPAAAAAGLLDRLRGAVAEFEARHGVLWSEHSVRYGAASDRRLGAIAGKLGADGAYMYALLKNLPLNGYERSLKLQPGRLADERFLLGIHRDALHPEQLAFILDALGMPTVFRAGFIARLGCTTFLHFGHEAGDGGTVRKVYQEFGSSSPEQDLLYLGYKWKPAVPEQCVLSRYVQKRGLDTNALRARIRALHGEQLAAAATTEVLLDMALQRSAADALLYVEVSEDGNPRLSYDLNLYAAQLGYADVAAALDSEAARLGIAPGMWQAQRAYLRHARIGHISAGIARDSSPFFTIYWLPRD